MIRNIKITSAFCVVVFMIFFMKLSLSYSTSRAIKKSVQVRSHDTTRYSSARWMQQLVNTDPSVKKSGSGDIEDLGNDALDGGELKWDDVWIDH